jgi:hypothetical protein
VDTAAFWNFAAARYSLVETDSPFWSDFCLYFVRHLCNICSWNSFVK